ncbi:MAG: GTPase HflX [Bacteroidales bacterium]|nr:GTPase HflX [Bacteroidales bacterium]
MEETQINREKAVLVGIVTPDISREKATEYLDELAFLVETAGGEEIYRFTQNLNVADPKFFVGSGKIEEIAEYVNAAEANLVVFDDELSPSQLRNIESVFKGVKVLDRTNLILDIFASRARTSHAMVQVELAQYQYLLPRLTRMWTHLERQRGGIGMRGPGETEIETDRRIIRDRIALLKKRLENIDKQMATQRKNRGKLVRVALVGYTNVGKSTIMNMLSKSEVFAENKLFATLDTTVRKVVVDNLPFLIADTVGFIRKLPHHLVESFKSTLDEVREADVLIHVVDISHPEFEDQINVVKQTLADLGCADKPTIMIFNKIDAYQHVEKEEDDLMPSSKENVTLDQLMSHWLAKENMPALFISAKTKENLHKFRSLLYEFIKTIHAQRFPFNEFLYDQYSENEM